MNHNYWCQGIVAWLSCDVWPSVCMFYPMPWTGLWRVPPLPCSQCVWPAIHSYMYGIHVCTCEYFLTSLSLYHKANYLTTFLYMAEVIMIRQCIPIFSAIRKAWACKMATRRAITTKPFKAMTRTDRKVHCILLYTYTHIIQHIHLLQRDKHFSSLHWSAAHTAGWSTELCGPVQQLDQRSPKSEQD